MRQPAEWQQKKAKKSRVEFAALAILLVPLAVGGLFLFRSTTGLAGASPSGSTLSQQILQAGSLQNTPSGTPIRHIPQRFQIQGTVDDQYTLAVDPKTGETLISDTLGGLGTNNTSIEGDRLRLAKDMLELDQYAEANQAKLTAAQYNWL